MDIYQKSATIHVSSAFFSISFLLTLLTLGPDNINMLGLQGNSEVIGQSFLLLSASITYNLGIALYFFLFSDTVLKDKELSSALKDMTFVDNGAKVFMIANFISFFSVLASLIPLLNAINQQIITALSIGGGLSIVCMFLFRIYIRRGMKAKIENTFRTDFKKIEDELTDLKECDNLESDFNMKVEALIKSFYKLKVKLNKL
ncbi:hypothetical protein CWB73_00510 [Pseudoalteromonas phenolica]|uniref:Uncharacterized protein n=1 Tax=Pseudoalteromonas phenolica TaxID=161398 RepID=A0A5S3YYW3_9GAMM|nr:hypothetical protein [Pseudoalteromonas phenolica]TMP84182.1 hypothetical protein CWB73_00510 [Pseudoalteromonas phenolica]